MPLVRVRDNETSEDRAVSDEWLTRWPDDFTVIESPDSPKETTPATGTNKKEKA